MIITLLLFSAFSHAWHERGDGPGPRRRCDLGQASACSAEHNRLREIELALLPGLRDRAVYVEREKNLLAESLGARANELSALQSTKMMAEKEQAWQENINLSTPIFMHGPALENIFFLGQESNSWEEKHGLERKARLTNLVGNSGTRADKISSDQQKIAMEIAALEAQWQALQAEILAHQNAADSHASMCNYGCQQQHCPEN